MKTEIIFGIIGGLCLLVGCISYIAYNTIQEENKRKVLAILSVLFTALGLGIFVGITNIKQEQQISNEPIEEVEETIENEELLDP